MDFLQLQFAFEKAQILNSPVCAVPYLISLQVVEANNNNNLASSLNYFVYERTSDILYFVHQDPLTCSSYFQLHFSSEDVK